MKTLFSKIFIWFFSAQILIGTVLYVVASSQRNETLPLPVQVMLEEQLRWRIRSAVLLAQSHQLQTFATHLDNVPTGGNTQEFQTRTAIFERTPQGAIQLLGKSQELTSEFEALALNAARQPRQVHQFQTSDYWGGALAAPLKNGAILIVVQESPRFKRPISGAIEDLSTPDGRLRFGVLVALMALVCYGLALYITTPVARLRAATQKLAEGNLGARVAFNERGGDELTALGRDFDLMATRLEQGVEAERRLLGDISHELRSPLARLTVALDLVEQKRARAEEQKLAVPETVYLGALERIGRESERLNELISQLLELTRLESLAEGNHVSESGERIALDELVAEVVADASYEARSRSFGVDLTENQACSLIGVRPLLYSAVENVVRNGVRYTRAGTNVQVSLRVVEGGKKSVAIVSVRDFGPGVPEEVLPLLFRPFYRVASGRDRQSGGVGLGLAIAERALRVHGASIEARNAPDGGLIMEIHLSVPERQTTQPLPTTPKIA